MADCIFCKLANGEIPTNVVYETEDIMAFEDANPQAPVHTLVVPKEHHANIADGVSEELMGKLFAAANKVAEIKGVKETGYRLIVNTGKDAAQTVEHVHVHVLGGRKMSEHM
jgi:histidine triad (HIT) family protein